MDVFNPKILDASIRDVSSCLTDNQKADLLLYAMRSLHLEGRSRTVVENAIQSCLQISTLSPENTAKARILRARARLTAGSHFGAQEDLQAALAAEPDNPEAKALLHQRSVTVEKLLSPLPRNKDRFSVEIWREIALFLPRRDLKALLFVPHALSRVASQLLFRELDLHFGTIDLEEETDSWPVVNKDQAQDSWQAQRSADILTQIIINPAFASAVRTLKIYAPKRDRDGSMAFQTGMLTNALPKLVNLRNVHISAGSEGITPVLKILDTPDGPTEFGPHEFKHLAHFSYTAQRGNACPVTPFIAQNRTTLRTISLNGPVAIFPSEAISIRNLTHISFSGLFPAGTQAFTDILINGRQLESLTLQCTLGCTASSQFRSLQSCLPFLRHFSFTVHGVSRRMIDRDLFPAIGEFLRDRNKLRTLQLTAVDDMIQRDVGFDASIWGVLPTLTNLRGLTISYPKDLAPGLAAWLVPRSVLALSLGLTQPTPALFTQLRPGIPHGLRYIGLSSDQVRASSVVELGFPMVHVICVKNVHWTVKKRQNGSISEVEPWPKRREMFHTKEWLEWLGCEDAEPQYFSEFPVV
ncbi:hypothetical protein BD779DRAFT_1539533 [Infundibulicybe gibba]|nr:hypothetical protein BD779DRAFT_1539533 [Infundibulicybe gibba]